MKRRRFAAGGETAFSPEQEAWLGKADRTDPYILARMRRAVPDRVNLAPVEDRQFTPVKQESPTESSAATDTDITDMKRSASSAADEDDTASMKRSAVSVKASRPAAAPVRSKPYAGTGGSGRGGQGGPTADEMAAYSAQQKAKRLSDMVRMPTTDEIQTGLDTATSLIGAGGLGRMLAKKLMQRGAATAAPAALPAPTPRLGYDKAEAAQQAIAAPVKRIGLDRTAARAAEQRKQDIMDLRAARQNARNQQMMAENQAAAERASARAASARSAAERPELGSELRRGAQQTKFTSPSRAAAAKRTRKFNEAEAGVEFKRGGSVKKYAKGGSIDGCAQRGKTKGRYL